MVFIVYFFCFETCSHSIAQASPEFTMKAGLELTVILLSQPPEGCSYKHKPPHPVPTVECKDNDSK